MSRLSRLIPALFVAIALAACSDAGNSPLGPDGPSYDTGVGAMGGNYNDDSTTVSTTSTTPEPTPTDTTTRSGVGAMGGN